MTIEKVITPHQTIIIIVMSIFSLMRENDECLHISK